jgi:nucleoside-diphosphate-sugar epimerase
VRVVTRSGRASRGSAGLPDGVTLDAADVADPAAAVRACAGAAVVYLCATPPYTARAWAREWPRLAAGALAGAEAAGARLVFGDNLYAYGAPPWGTPAGALREDTPYAPAGPKGRARLAAAERLLAAHAAGRVAVAIGRASDFYGPGARHAVLGDGVFPAALAGRPARVLGDIDQPHTLTYVEDFGRALVVLGAHDAALGRAWHVPNAPTVSVRAFLALVYAAAGHPLRVRAAGRALVGALGLVSPALRELRETVGWWERPYVVDDGAFRRAFGAAFGAATPHADAIRRTLAWYRPTATP